MKNDNETDTLLLSPGSDTATSGIGSYPSRQDHSRKCEKLLSLSAIHLSGAEREGVEQAVDQFDSYSRSYVDKLYSAREREALLRGETWNTDSEVKQDEP